MDCPNCQFANPDSAKFCSNCGTKLEAPRPIQGERRLVTVLFADVVGSTSMAEQMDPEQVTEIMNGAFEFMNDAVGRYEGTVSRLMGDAILAFFGAPVAHENDPERALSAALDIRDAAKDYAQTIQRRFGVEFNLRVGVNTGLVVLATVGDQLRSEQTVMGDTVNVAARLQQAAEPGEVLISAETLRLTRHAFETEPRGSVQLKGKSEPVETFSVLQRKATPGQGRGLEGITSHLVGRTAERQALRSRLQELLDGQGSLVTLIGEAGLGKSRLIAELRSEASSQHATRLAWFETRALSYGQTTPFEPWRSLIRQLIGASDGDPPATVRQKLLLHVADLNQAADQILFLESLLAVEYEDEAQQIASLDGNVLRDGLCKAVQELIRELARKKQLVVVFDDLHWSDSVSLDLLEAVAELVRTEPLVLITALRPDRQAPSWSFIDTDRSGERYTEIWLEPLESTDAEELLGNLLHVEDLPQSIREMILTKSDGNPFFLEEVIRTLVDSNYIVRSNGHWRATGEIVNVSVPDTLVGVLSARIDRLPWEARYVAQVAATIGRIFSYPILKAVCAGAPEPERIDEPEPHLRELTTEGLIRERVHQPDMEYIFKHALTQEAAYSLLLVRTRREYHLRTGKVLEEVHANRLDEFAATLAHHFHEGEAWSKAIEYSLRAGKRAEEQFYALREAHDHYERAYRTLGQMLDSPGGLEVEVVLAGMNTALKFLPRAEVLDRLHEAEKIAREIGDKRQLSQVLHWIAHIHSVSGFLSRALPALQENYALSEELGDQRLSLYPSWAMAFAMLNSDPGLAASRLEEIGENARKFKNRHLEVHSFGGAAVGYARLGNYAKAREALRQARGAADQTDEPVTEADYNLLASFAYLDMDEHQLSLEHGKIGIDQALKAGAMECAATGYCAVGMGNLMAHDPTNALHTFEQSHRYLEQFRADINIVNQVDAGMAIARHSLGETEELSQIEDALQRSASLEDHYMVASISKFLAEAYLRLGDLDHAEQRASAAVDYYRRNQMRPHLARALEVQAEVLDARGLTDRAVETRVEAEGLRAGSDSET